MSIGENLIFDAAQIITSISSGNSSESNFEYFQFSENPNIFEKLKTCQASPISKSNKISTLVNVK